MYYWDIMKPSIKSITIANTYKKNEGITRVAKLYNQALIDLGFDVKFLQLTYGDELSKYSEQPIEGRRLPLQNISKALNILFVFPKVAGQSHSDLLILSDPWLLRSVKYRNHIVLIFHDIRQLTSYREGLMASLLFRVMLLYLKRVDRIICVSESCKNELVNRKLVDERRVYVINNSLFPEEIKDHAHSEEEVTRLYNYSRKTSINIVYVAANQKHKNIDFYMVIASNIIKKYGERFVFHLVSNIREEKVPSSLREKTANFIVVHDITDLDSFYSQMDLLLFPSSYEGFGIPLIEAMSHGLPVIALGIPTTKEIVGVSGILLDKLDSDEWESALLKMMDEGSYRCYSHLAYERAKLYDYSLFKDAVSKFFSD